MLQPIDLYVVLKLAVLKQDATYAELAHALGLSTSQVHRAVGKARRSGLVREGSMAVLRHALLEFLVHGVKYVFPAQRGPVARGVPTAHSAKPLRNELTDFSQEFVWPDSEGMTRGESVEPLHKQVPDAARRDPELYELLALIDALRIGRAREREMATKYLQERLGG